MWLGIDVSHLFLFLRVYVGKSIDGCGHPPKNKTKKQTKKNNRRTAYPYFCYGYQKNDFMTS